MKYLALLLLLLTIAGCANSTPGSSEKVNGVTIEVISQYTSPHGYNYHLVKIYGNGVVTYQLVK